MPQHASNMRITLFTVVIFLWSCQNTPKENTAILQKVDLESITCIDTFNNTLKLDIAHSISEADFKPLYIGPLKNSINLDYRPGHIGSRFSYNKGYENPNTHDLKLHVDTTQYVGSVNRLIVPVPKKNHEYKSANWRENFSRGDTKSYPIFIQNQSKDTLMIGSGEYLPLIIEAQDSLGNWKPVQSPFMYFCGTGLSNFYLPPNHLAVSSCKLFEGEYETQMRLVFGYYKTAVSNEFKGRMNYQQFTPSKEKQKFH